MNIFKNYKLFESGGDYKSYYIEFGLTDDIINFIYLNNKDKNINLDDFNNYIKNLLNKVSRIYNDFGINNKIINGAIEYNLNKIDKSF